MNMIGARFREECQKYPRKGNFDIADSLITRQMAQN